MQTYIVYFNQDFEFASIAARFILGRAFPFRSQYTLEQEVMLCLKDAGYPDDCIEKIEPISACSNDAGIHAFSCVCWAKPVSEAHSALEDLCGLLAPEAWDETNLISLLTDKIDPPTARKLYSRHRTAIFDKMTADGLTPKDYVTEADRGNEDKICVEIVYAWARDLLESKLRLF